MTGNTDNAPSGDPAPGTVVEDQREAVDFLSSPVAHGGKPVRVIETHGAYVFLAGDRALKMKRAVWFPYMDFSTLEKRRHFCEAELRLNRRTAPSIYREVLPLTRESDGGLTLGGRGEVVDWVVVMARFDEDTLFDRLAQRGALTDALLDALADAIAAFHASAERRPDTDFAAAMRGTIEGNAGSLRSWLGKPFEAEAVERVDRRCQSLLEASSSLLVERGIAGFVRHCHGDLHLRNICLVDGKPTLFDCIEFKESFAVIDVLYDLSFLLMDLEHRGLRREANRVLNRYLARTGDFGGLGALQLYLCARAEIRAHVSAAMAAAQDDPAEAARDCEEAMAYLNLVEAFATPAAPALIAVGGLSGSGKTTLAQALAPGMGGAPGAVTVRSDVLRKRRFGVDLFEKLPEAAYARIESERVYDELYRKAGELLASGVSVIADAVFRNEMERRTIEKIAKDAGVPFVGLWLVVSPSEQDARLEARTRDASDATVDIGRAQRQTAEPVSDWPTLNADMGIADLCAAAAPLLAKAGIRYDEG
jgi:aminoglycoside phosphotransferase family enzyme/predicted kinase